jgi:hypothetical protein
MRLYDFSAYAKRRDDAQSAERIRALVPHLNEPGVVLEFKRQVEGWLILHQDIDQILGVKG